MTYKVSEEENQISDLSLLSRSVLLLVNPFLGSCILKDLFDISMV